MDEPAPCFVALDGVVYDRRGVHLFLPVFFGLVFRLVACTGTFGVILFEVVFDTWCSKRCAKYVGRR